MPFLKWVFWVHKPISWSGYTSLRTHMDCDMERNKLVDSYVKCQLQEIETEYWLEYLVLLVGILHHTNIPDNDTHTSDHSNHSTDIKYEILQCFWCQWKLFPSLKPTMKYRWFSTQTFKLYFNMGYLMSDLFEDHKLTFNIDDNTINITTALS